MHPLLSGWLLPDLISCSGHDPDWNISSLLRSGSGASPDVQLQRAFDSSGDWEKDWIDLGGEG